MKETDYYNNILAWLEEEFEYYIGGGYYRGDKELFYIDKGPTMKCRLDIIGIKNIGSHNTVEDNIEIIGIEVKDDKTIKYQHLAQTSGYKIFVHKAYLATTAKITSEDLYWARILGVGLITIESKNSFKIVLEASLNEPNQTEMLRLLESLSIGVCTICRNYFFTWDIVDNEKYKTYVKLRRVKQINILQKGELDNYKDLFEKQKSFSKEDKFFRYICKPCATRIGI